ncbi:MAG: hypothetical protein ACREX1_20425 [Advenella sp.]
MTSPLSDSVANALAGTGTTAGQVDDSIGIKATVRLAKQDSQHLLLGAGKQRIRQTD